MLLGALAIQPGWTVCDMGCGNGFYTLQIARLVGPAGKVLAVDIQPEMLHLLAERAAGEGATNVEPILGTVVDPKLPQDGVDLLLLVDVYHHIEDRERYFRALGASLRPGGRIAIIDFTLDSPQGPPRAARVAPEIVHAEMKAAGHALAAEHRFLPYQYFLVFQPAP